MACSNYDQVITLDSIELTNTTLELTGSYVPQLGETFTLFSGQSDHPRGKFTGLPEGATLNFNGAELSITYVGGSGLDVALEVISVLPVELVSFTGEAEAKWNTIKWITGNEDAFSHFEVERSVDGVGQWTLLDKVQGAAAGAESVGEELRYTYTEVAPPASAYYRLKMVDLDGGATYSKVVLLEREIAGELFVFPNPNDGRFSVRLPAEDNVEFILYDLNGYVVWRSEGSSAASSLTQSGSSSDVSVVGVVAGVYLLTAQTSKDHWMKRVIIRRSHL